ncbi:MAG TPA: DUF1800 family protein, partial [Nevskiaceae bacterium]|nr:DUF1800 family protein [Nevskiaceae bacterium]
MDETGGMVMMQGFRRLWAPALILWSGAALAGPVLKLQPTFIAFHNVNVGADSTVHAVTVSNTGDAALTFKANHITGANAGDFPMTTTCGATLAAGASCTVSITFHPRAGGDRAASLTVTSNAPGNPHTTTLTGVGLQTDAAAQPSTLDYGTLLIDTSATQTTSIVNVGNLPLHVGSVSLTGTHADQFALVHNGCSNPVGPTHSCNLSVRFTATATGKVEARLLVASDAPHSPTAIVLAGAGRLPEPGNISMVAPSKDAAQADGSVEIAVARTDGWDGAVSVNFATHNGSAKAGTDYTTATGTLNWGNHDGRIKTIRVALSRDTPFQGARTLTVTVAKAAGGAALGDTTQTAVNVYGSVTNTTLGDAVRFLEQSSFGPTDGSIAAVRTLGIPAYLDQQLAMPPTGYPGSAAVSADSGSGCPSGSSACLRDRYTTFPVATRFYRNALTGEDQLRQRVAWALSQIFVISGVKNSIAYGMRDYQQMLLADAFGNFRQLLNDVTLSPMMGYYLDMVNNDKPNGDDNPNENYARELMQLFTIGTVMLNDDGTPKLDGKGRLIPTYDQDIIEGFAHTFTGWTYPPAPGEAKQWTGTPWFRGDMPQIPAHHDTGSKELLRGTVLPAGQTQSQDLSGAVGNIFRHPNVGPFIGRQLIQFLVTSNPSPAYVSRITAVFNDNGSGVRGDLKAVVRAILLDPEARGNVKKDAAYGKLREPVLFATGVLRGLGGTTQSDGQYPFEYCAWALDQNVFSPPTVFNFYPPDYPLQGTSLVGPPFGIYNTNTSVQRADFVNRLLTPPYAVAA